MPTFILVKSSTWNIEGAINNLGSKASTTGCMEKREKKWTGINISYLTSIIYQVTNDNCQILLQQEKDYIKMSHSGEIPDVDSE